MFYSWFWLLLDCVCSPMQCKWKLGSKLILQYQILLRQNCLNGLSSPNIVLFLCLPQSQTPISSALQMWERRVHCCTLSSRGRQHATKTCTLLIFHLLYWPSFMHIAKKRQFVWWSLININGTEQLLYLQQMKHSVIGIVIMRWTDIPCRPQKNNKN